MEKSFDIIAEFMEINKKIYDINPEYMFKD